MGKSKQVADSLKSLFERVPEIDSWSTEGETVKNLEGAIKFRDVHFRYPTRPTQPVLRGISLKIDLGQYVALVGPSGCGKSTIVSLMERFYDPKIGSILLDGRDISQLNLKAFRSRIGHERVANEAVARACKDANIYDFIMSLPYGLDAVVGWKGVMLSGGQKQRIAIARTLIRDPKNLLLDEATSALDSTSEHVVQEVLDKTSRGRTTIAIAHRLSTVQNADVIYVIDKGQVVESGNHEVLMQRRGQYWELVQLQGLRGKEEGSISGFGVPNALDLG
ncbi:multidrug resistance protein 4 [Leptodontidium sp. MPI-SDFR-AT-0119]|nr:multidrug resistance protein 4 [Leptodontidium sp. MPI-SDFR-AT-0119]